MNVDTTYLLVYLGSYISFKKVFLKIPVPYRYQTILLSMAFRLLDPLDIF